MKAEEPCANQAHVGLLRDVVKLKQKRDELIALVSRQSAALEVLRRAAIAEHVRGRLLRGIEDFDQFIGVENVIGDDLQVDWFAVDARIDALLTKRPELGVRQKGVDGAY